jgi:hypothetical protein
VKNVSICWHIGLLPSLVTTQAAVCWQATHLEQAELRAAMAGGGLAGRSYLGGLLPESLLYVLQVQA